MKKLSVFAILSIMLLDSTITRAQVVLEQEVKITDIALHFDGQKVNARSANTDEKYDYIFGPQISAHGDCIKMHENYVFMSWWRGDQTDRHMMLSRYDTITGSIKTIEFPHQHTGHNNYWYLGESHNTIGVGISPLDGTIHLIFDMHAYNESIPDGAFADDYFRYAYSVQNAATVPDEAFNLGLFVADNPGDYNHLSLKGRSVSNDKFGRFTYPKFFLNDDDDLFMYMRKWSSSNGGYHFAKYDANTSTWSDFIEFADYHASDHGQPYDWGMYGNMKYLNGKIRVGFQRRSNNKNDKYLYQNGFYYAYSNDQSGKTQWKDHTGASVSIPIRDADVVKVSEPGDLVTTTTRDKVYMVRGFDWTVTKNGDVHIIGEVRDTENDVRKKVHTYRPAGKTEFITTTEFAGGSRLYTAGSNIYIIGLNAAGRIYIEKSEGGKNNFERIYEPTSGRQFRHGVAYVNQGKLYYYMMERSSGQKRPLYLQIIDLGIPPEDLEENDETILNVSNQDLSGSSEITLFPNPANDRLIIKSGHDWPLDFSIYNMSGRKMLHGTAKHNSIDIRSLATGIYIVHLQNEQLNKRIKFVIE